MTGKKAAKKGSAKKKPAVRKEPEDLRAHIEPTKAGFTAVIDGVRRVLPKIPKPEEPCEGDLVHAVIHLIMTDGLPCGIGQEVVRRVEEYHVDRNEFRVTEAYEVAEILVDLDLPKLFDRCLSMHDAIEQIYNDQNSVSLGYLREATVGERKSFFQRTPGIPVNVAKQLVYMILFEECLFSDRSTVRVQQRLGFDSNSSDVQSFFVELRDLVKDYGHLPLLVGPDSTNGKPTMSPVLSPGCMVLRLAPPLKRR